MFCSIKLKSPSPHGGAGGHGYRRRDLNLGLGSLPSSFLKIGDCSDTKGGSFQFQVRSDLLPGRLEGYLVGENGLRKQSSNKLQFVRTLLIDNYDSYTYNIFQQLSTINGVPPVVVRNDEWTWDDVVRYLYKEKAFDNIVISPGPGSPTCPADIGICLRILIECWDIPILGVCLGHQALGYVHGAEIVHAPEPIHGRLSEIEHYGCNLFDGIPSGKNSGFKVVRYHSLVINAESLPIELKPIAWTASMDAVSYLDGLKIDTYSAQFQNGRFQSIMQSRRTGSEKVLMGIMHSSRPHYGVQFHPESVATCYGRKIFKNFREITEDYWLRSSSSLVNERNIHYTACMQVPSASQFFSDVSRSQSLLNKSNAFHGKGEAPHIIHDAYRSNLEMFGILNLQYPNAGLKFLKLKWKKVDNLARQVGGAKIFCELFGNNKVENTFWLDSSSIEKNRARYSFMGGKGGSLWKQLTFRLSDQSDKDVKCGGHLLIEDAQGCTNTKNLEEGFFDFLNKELLSIGYDKKDFEGLPFDFYGGFVGYIGYDLKVECGANSNRHRSRTPDACFFFADNLVVIDHSNDDVYILTLHEKDSPPTSWQEETEQKLLRLRTSSRKLDKQKLHPATVAQSKSTFVSDKSREDYLKDVQNCQKYIKDGESYELCLTTQIRKEVRDMHSLGLYLYLREKNPSPYAAWFNFSKQDLSICCSSPERFLRLDKNDILEAKPIKGTIARGSTPEEDEQLKLRLQYSEKDQAENLMIVDLLRNDLGRVCEPGSVYVPHLMDVESYATVHTMVSTIRGKKHANVTAVDCVRAAFPGGSMTGAPKLRSMELLDSIESCSRGIYSGSIGFFSYNQTFDLNIVIRTVVIHEGEASIGAGGAIISLSNPEDEYEEMILKTQAPAKAVMEFNCEFDT